MKIAISGSQGSGKTTLLNVIKEKRSFPEYTLITEIVRTLIQQGVQINRGADHISQMRILEAHYKNILREENFITDRCAVDAFVYATYDYLQGNYTYQEHKQHEEIFLSCIKSYDLFFYLPIEFSLQEDGVRDTDVDYQQEIHRLFLTIYKKYKLNPIALTGAVKDRLNSFDSHLWFITSV